MLLATTDSLIWASSSSDVLVYAAVHALGLVLVDNAHPARGIDWVVQHAHDPGGNIPVLNLSFGTNSTQAYTLDPLAYAVEVAWRAGIVVVTSAGNKGTGGMTNPATDPYVAAPPASEPHGGSGVCGVDPYHARMGSQPFSLASGSGQRRTRP